MKRAVASAVFLALAIIVVFGQKPDFAFPKQVEKKATADYKAGMRKGDDTGALRALIDLTIATNSVDIDQAPTSLQRISDFCAEAKSAEAKSLGYLLAAELYAQIYRSDAYKFDNRADTGTPESTDISLWSGNTFRTKISELVDSALAHPEALKRAPLTHYSGLLTYSPEAAVCFPSLYDFAVQSAISLLTATSRVTTPWLPVEAVAPWPECRHANLQFISPECRRILMLYDDVIEFHAEHEAPAIQWQLERLRYIAECNTGSAGHAAMMEALKTLFRRYSNSEYSGDILSEIYSRATDDPNLQSWIYDHCNDNIAKYPAFPGTPCLKNIIDAQALPNARIEFPSQTRPGAPVAVVLHASNINRCRVNLIKLDKIPQKAYVEIAPNAKAEAWIDIDLAGRIPFQCDTTLTFNLPLADCAYVFTVEWPGVAGKNKRTTSYMLATSLYLGTTHYSDNQVVVVDSNSGSPVGDATISGYGGYPASLRATFTSDKNGFATLPPSDDLNLIATKGSQRSASRHIYFRNFYNDDQDATYLNIYTSLGIYRPGDTVDWALVASRRRGMHTGALEGARAIVTFYDANYQAIDTLNVFTDSFGRAQGAFSIPKGLLTGVYMIEATLADPLHGGISQPVMVSDYKLPTFEITLDRALINSPSDGDVTLKGRVATYAGFSLADARVSMTLSAARRWRWFFNSSKIDFYSTDSVAVDADGCFSLTIPAEVLRLSPYPTGYFTAQFTAVSTVGESQMASTSFSLGSTANLAVSLPDNIDISCPVAIDASATDSDGNKISTTINYCVENSLGVAQTGHFETTNPTVDWRKIPGGTYTITFTCAADTCTLENRCLYHPSDRYSPSTALLWTPSQHIDTKGADTELLLGTTAESTTILINIDDGIAPLSQRWVTLRRGMHRLPLTLPSDTTVAHVTLITVNRYRTQSLYVECTPARAHRDIKIHTSTFRDKLISGQPEVWTFRVTDSFGKPVEAAIMTDLYNRALDNLASHYWDAPQRYTPLKVFTSDFSGIDNHKSVFFQGQQGHSRDCRSLLMPSFNTWDQPLYPAHRYGTFRMMKQSAMLTAAGAPAADNGVAVEECAMVDMAATTAAMGDDVDAEEKASGSEAAYRPAEVPLGFFKPLLTTDADGAVSVAFIAPNANSSWSLQMLAFTRRMFSDSFRAEITTSKPVMVQANTPRFLRTGDNATIEAMVMNNSDRQLTITTVMQLFDPATDRITASDTVVSVLAPHTSSVAALSTGTLGETAALGYRVKSSTDLFTDGEQTVIPVLSTIKPVTETYTFYSAPSEQLIRLSIPASSNDDDTRYTLQYTENPLWTVLTALPGLRSAQCLTSTAAADALYAALTATSLIKQQPETASAIRRWADNPTDSVLVSALSKNSELKDLLLQATPWVVDAMTATERMQRLALLLDTKATETAVNSAVDILARCVCSDGGWRWSSSTADDGKSSTWATMRILEVLGLLHEQGAAPSANKRLSRMIDNAVAWLDAETARQFAKYPDADYTRYARIRLMYPHIKQSTAAKRASDAALHSIINNWKSYDSRRKAYAAIILEKSGHHATALLLLQSLREYAIVSPSMGMTWRAGSQARGNVLATSLILSAFHTIEPNSPDIDKIRQWLILSKETEDWGESMATAWDVNAILTTSQRWIRPARPAHFYFGDSEFEPSDHPELYSGYLNTSVPAAIAAGATLSIVKDADSPAYGAVFARRNADMRHIEPHRVDDLAIQKHTYALRNGRYEETTDLKVGDRVRVELVVDCRRDLDFVAITDCRAACLEPVEQTPQPILAEGVWFYRENLDAETRIFLDRLPRGSYRIAYDMFINNPGTFTSGIATVTCHEAPRFTAHSGGSLFTVEK